MQWSSLVAWQLHEKPFLVFRSIIIKMVNEGYACEELVFEFGGAFLRGLQYLRLRRCLLGSCLHYDGRKKSRITIYDLRFT